LDVQFVIVVRKIDIGSVVIQTLESVSVIATTNGIDAVGMNEYLYLVRYYHPNIRPNVIDGNSHIVVVHCVNLNQLRIVHAHIDVAAILLNQFWSIVTIRQ